MKPGRDSNDKQRGQSLVEMAVGVTFLLLLLGGIVDLGRMLFSFIAIRDAAQEGALYGSVNPTDTAGIIARVRNTSNVPVDLTSASDVHITPTIFGTACSGSAIRVEVQYEFEISMPFLGSVLGRQHIPLTATVTDTILKPKCPSPYP